jgi:hypothetical protein
MTRRHLLLTYQLLLAASDTATGILLLAAPTLTLNLMHLTPPDSAALPYLSYIGVFVLSTGLACLYGAWLVSRQHTARPNKIRQVNAAKLEVVWLLTAITRAAVCLFVLTQIVTSNLETGWLTVALTDGLIALIQFTGLTQDWLTRGWLANVLP